jgi:glycosyltransferase involved in cell wall biosynthesis
LARAVNLRGNPTRPGAINSEMLSIIIATLDSERPLVRTLAALVPGATAGLITEVVIADAGSRDDTAAVADIAGCKFILADGPLGRRLQAAAEAARAPWLMFLRPGTILDTPWIGEARSFVERPQPDVRAGVFRRAAPAQARLSEALSLLASALGAKPRPEQGLIIAADFYRQSGGHSERAIDPESDLLRRIGRRRITTLSARAFQADT